MTVTDQLSLCPSCAVDGISLRSISDLADAQTQVQVPGSAHTHAHTKHYRTPLVTGSSSIGSAVDSAKSSSSSSSAKGSAASTSQSVPSDIYTDYHRRADIAYSAVMHKELELMMESAHEEYAGKKVHLYSDSESTYPGSSTVHTECSLKILGVNSDVCNDGDGCMDITVETGSRAHGNDTPLIELGSTDIARREVAVTINGIVDDIISGDEKDYVNAKSSISATNAESVRNTEATKGIPNICPSPLAVIEIEAGSVTLSNMESITPITLESVTLSNLESVTLGNLESVVLGNLESVTLGNLESVTLCNLESVTLSNSESEEGVSNSTVPAALSTPTISALLDVNSDSVVTLSSTTLPSVNLLLPSYDHKETTHPNPTLSTHITPHINPHPIEPDTSNRTLHPILESTHVPSVPCVQHVQSVLTPTLSAAVKAALLALVEVDRGKGDVVCLDYLYLRHECGLDLETLSTPTQSPLSVGCHIPDTTECLLDNSVVSTCVSGGVEVRVEAESVPDIVIPTMRVVTQSENEGVGETTVGECVLGQDNTHTTALTAPTEPSNTHTLIDERNKEKTNSTDNSEEGKVSNTIVPSEYRRNLKRSRTPATEEQVGVPYSDTDDVSSNDKEEIPPHASTYNSGRTFVLTSGKSVMARVGNSISKLAAFSDLTQHQANLSVPPLPSGSGSLGRDKVKDGEKEKLKSIRESQRESEKHSKSSRKRKKGKQIENQPIISLDDSTVDAPVVSQDAEELKTFSDHVKVEVEAEVYSYRTHFTMEKYSFFDQICDFHDRERKKKRLKGVYCY